ncbi:MAG: hypothetical protein ABEH77_11300 [Halobacteriaceae archaeon]
MIVVVADAESFGRVADALPDRPVEHATTAAEAPLAGALVVVVDTAAPGAADLVADLRDGPRFPPALVVVARGDLPGELLPADEVVDGFAPAAVAEAVERALLAAEYRRAVDRLYDACADRAEAGTTDPLAESEELREARRSADEVLAAAADRGLLTALLRGRGDE